MPADQATTSSQGTKKRRLSAQQKKNTKKTKMNKVGGCDNNIEEPQGNRIDPEVHGIDIEKFQGGRIDA